MYQAGNISLDTQTNMSFISPQSFGCTAGHVWEISEHFAECIVYKARNKADDQHIYHLGSKVLQVTTSWNIQAQKSWNLRCWSSIVN